MCLRSRKADPWTNETACFGAKVGSCGAPGICVARPEKGVVFSRVAPRPSRTQGATYGWFVASSRLTSPRRCFFDAVGECAQELAGGGVVAFLAALFGADGAQDLQVLFFFVPGDHALGAGLQVFE